MKLFLTAALLMLASSALVPAHAGQASRDLVRASLVPAKASIEPGQTISIAVHLEMKPGWHVYWRNPGDSGLPPEIEWQLPDGFSAGPIAWPVPERIPVQHLMNFGYEGDVALLVPLTATPSVKPGEPAHIGAKLSYLVCEEICVPGSAEIGLDLPVAASGGTSQAVNGGSNEEPELFARTRSALPQPSAWPTRLTAEGDRWTLHLDRSGLAEDAVSGVAFFPYAETVLDNAAEQPASVDATGLHVSLKPSDPAASAPSELAGVLRFDEKTSDGTVARVLAIGRAPDAQPNGATAAGEPGPAAPAAQAADTPSLWSAIALALVGGLLLNLMPCVFPVLSIKVMSLVHQSGESLARVRWHGLAYTAGVLASFVALAGLLIALKAGGAGIGWGFQLQSPAFVAGLAYLMLAVGLSMSGVVHVGGAIVGLGDGLTRRSGFQGSFFTGVLATVVATPCTAPFMGAAVGFALTQPPILALAVFVSLGLGLALPFLLLTAYPRAVTWLPRPGAWMDTLKGALAFPVYATVAWLIWVLSQQVGANGLFAVLLGLVLVGFAAWAWERANMASSYGRAIGRGGALAAILATAGLVLVARADPAAERSGASAAAPGTEAFTLARLDGLRAEGRNVFVDMTAAWCITCQVNERGVLADEAVRAAFERRGVVTLRGDWTNQNPEITRLLERYGRSGVPLYLLYQGRDEAEVLPQILTKGLVLEAVEKLNVSDAVRTGALAAPQR